MYICNDTNGAGGTSVLLFQRFIKLQSLFLNVAGAIGMLLKTIIMSITLCQELKLQELSKKMTREIFKMSSYDRTDMEEFIYEYLKDKGYVAK